MVLEEGKAGLSVVLHGKFRALCSHLPMTKVAYEQRVIGPLRKEIRTPVQGWAFVIAVK